LLNNAFALNITLVELAVMNLMLSTFINLGFCLIPQLVDAIIKRSKVTFFIIFLGIYVYLRITKIRFINWYPLYAY